MSGLRLPSLLCRQESLQTDFQEVGGKDCQKKIGNNPQAPIDGESAVSEVNQVSARDLHHQHLVGYSSQEEPDAVVEQAIQPGIRNRAGGDDEHEENDGKSIVILFDKKDVISDQAEE